MTQATHPTRAPRTMSWPRLFAARLIAGLFATATLVVLHVMGIDFGEVFRTALGVILVLVVPASIITLLIMIGSHKKREDVQVTAYVTIVVAVIVTAVTCWMAFGPHYRWFLEMWSWHALLSALVLVVGVALTLLVGPWPKKMRRTHAS